MTKVFKAICDRTKKTETKITERAIRYRIKAFKKTQNIASRKLAKIAYANEMGINVDNLVNPQDLKELQEWLSNRPSQQSTVLAPKTKKIVTAKVHKKVVAGFGLPPNLIDEANKMADVYPDLYQLENLVRYVIMSVLEEKYTANWWENRSVVSKTIADHIEKRKHFEKKNKWVAKRGTHNIFYTTFGELARIINLNAKDFKKIFADMEIEAELRKLEPLRNIIAHNNPLPPIEINRIKTALADLEKQLKDYNERKGKSEQLQLQKT